MKFIFASLTTIFALLLQSTVAFADQQVIDGVCGSESHTAEGALGEAAIISNNGDILVQFSQKESHHNPSLAYAGRMSSNKDIMNVERVYFAPQDYATVSDGACKFFYKNKALTGIMCGAKLDETGRRTTAIVTFDVEH